jgi:hypothetical protein
MYFYLAEQCHIYFLEYQHAVSLKLRPIDFSHGTTLNALKAWSNSDYRGVPFEVTI